MKRYTPKDIENKWQKVWEEQGIHRATEDPEHPKRYVLEYFPYPSGAAMHVGHVRNYTIGDVISRHLRMQGYNVLHPMGWDAFGLPAENYAIKTGVSPRQAIDENTGRFKRQLMQMGFGYDWSREIDSTDPAYYKWTQWFFLMLFNRGLAYRKESTQWWCPVDKTVLANEQVENGQCWRCGTQVEKKALQQWFFKITDYADRLEKDLDDVNWSDSIKTMQRNWIGHKTGIDISYTVDNSASKEIITTFTTRPDTNFGATFVVLAPEHPFVTKVMKQEVAPTDGPSHWQAVGHYVQKSLNKSELERQEEGRLKTGAFTGFYVTNPLNKRRMPIWVSDFVLAGFGTGAVVGVPGHDMRDFQFAQQFDIPIERVVVGPDGDTSPVAKSEQVQEKAGKMVNSQFLDGLDIHEATEKMKDHMEQMGMGKRVHSYRIRDWLISRQRYWGAPIPIVHCMACAVEKGKAVKKPILNFYKDDIWQALLEGHKTVESRALNPEEKDRYFGNVKEVFGGLNKNSGARVDFTVLETRQYKNLEHFYSDTEFATAAMTGGSLPAYEKFREGYAALAEGYLEKIDKNGLIAWRVTPAKAPIPVPEDQLPVVLPEVHSYEPSGDGRSPLANVPEFVNTTCPDCGSPAERETDTMDGFACSSWYFLRFADPHNEAAAFDPEKAKFWLPVDDYIGGAEHAVMHLLYARFWTKVMFDEGLITFQEPFKTLRNHGMILAPDGAKMSKSKGNTIEPDVLIQQGYGADTIRIMELFIGPWNQRANWSVEGMGGSHRFLQRVWVLAQETLEAQPTDETFDDKALKTTQHAAVKRVGKDLEALGFNTAIAALMEYTNDLYKYKATIPQGSRAWIEALLTLLQLLAPFAPHITEELWQQLRQEGSIHVSPWPKYDEKLLVRDTMKIVVQVNGKLRGDIEVPVDATEEAVLSAARANEKVAVYLEGHEVKKSIYVPKKLVSFVI